MKPKARARARDLIERLWRWVDHERVPLPFTSDTAILERLYLVLLDLAPPESEARAAFAGPGRLRRAVVKWLQAYPSEARAFFERIADRKDGRFPDLREYHLLIAEQSLYGEPALAPLSRNDAVRWVVGVEADDPSPRHSATATTPNEAIIEFIVTSLLVDGRIVSRADVCNAREDAYDLLPELVGNGLVQPWTGELLVVTPAGLARAPDHLTEKLILWADASQPKLADADRQRQNQVWSIAELATRCGLIEAEMRIAILYRALFLSGCDGVVLDKGTALPAATRLRFEIRLPRTSLMQKVAAAKTDLDRDMAAGPDPVSARFVGATVGAGEANVRALRARLTNGENPTYPADSTTAAPLPPVEPGATELFGVAVQEGVDLLLLTATPVERDAVLRRMTPLPGRSAIGQAPVHSQTYFVGQLGAARVVLAMSPQCQGSCRLS